MNGLRRIRLAILISGRGSNMGSLLQACAQPDYPAAPVLVLSNRPEAAGIDTARAAAIPVAVIDHKPYGKDREAFETQVDAALRAAGTELVALAGFMRILSPFLVSRWAGRMVNIHPSLLPKYAGLDTHARAIAAGDAEAGCTVHHVTDGVDEGEIIAQARVPVLPDDTPEALAGRVLAQEHRLYPQAVADIARRLQAGRVI